MGHPMTGKVYKRVLQDPTPFMERLYRISDVWMTTPGSTSSQDTFYDTEAFFIVGLIGLCVLILILCVLITGLAYRLCTRYRRHRAYEDQRRHSPIYRPVVQTRVNSKLQTERDTHAALTIETEVTPHMASHQPLNNLNKVQRVSTPKLDRHLTKLPVTQGVMNITQSPFHREESSLTNNNHQQQQLFGDFGSQNLSPLQAEVQLKYYYKLPCDGSHNKLNICALNDLQTDTKTSPPNKLLRDVLKSPSTHKLYTLTFDVESDTD